MAQQRLTYDVRYPRSDSGTISDAYAGPIVANTPHPKPQRILRHVSIIMIDRKTMLTHLTNNEDRSGRSKECNKYEDVERTESSNHDWTVSILGSKPAIQEDARKDPDITCIASNFELGFYLFVVVITYLRALCHGLDSCQPFSGP